MQKKLLLLSCSVLSLLAKEPSLEKLEKYKQFLEEGTYANQDWSSFSRMPLSRFYTFSKAFEHFAKNNGKIIVELGTTHSYVDGAYEGCDSNDIKYWQPNNPKVWDWGAGAFTLMASECLSHLNPIIYTVDLDRNALNRCKKMTEPYNSFINYIQSDSSSFLRKCDLVGKIDLLYVDTGYMWPIEPTANIQLAEVIEIVKRNLLSPNGIILIDDVRNQTPKKFGETSNLGKSKYAIPYLVENGFEIIEDEYQVIIQRKK